MHSVSAWKAFLYQAIADKFNAMGFRSRRGKRFTPMSVQRLDRPAAAGQGTL